MAGEGETIVAPATPRGTSAIAVVRVSGPETRNAFRALFGTEPPAPRRVKLARWRDASGAVVDEMLAVFFPGPNSFTGEDSAEFFPHGNPLLSARLVREIARLPGCRVAEPGEFTRRAFENGKIDLAQAEAVAAAIHARTDAALKLARRLAEGKLSAEVRDLADSATRLSALVELEMDFAEEEADPDVASWGGEIGKIRGQVQKLLRGWERARRAARVPRVVLCGAPNAGKSSLANALLEEDRLLVSDRPGTTRDWVEAALALPGGEVSLCDTAGLGDAVDELDAKSQERSRALLAGADLVLLVEDGTATGAASPAPPGIPDGIPVLAVRTRADLPAFRGSPAAGADVFPVGCPDGTGIPALRERIGEIVFSRVDDGEALVATERQADALEKADGLLAEAESVLAARARTSPEIVADLLRRAREELRTITGEIAPDDVLGRIFSGFCIGK